MMIPCPFHYFTGFDCPLCGAQRGLLALWNGDVVGWWQYNPVLWCLMPYFAVLFFAQLYRPARSWRWVIWLHQNRVGFAVLLILVVWGIVRNLLRN